MTQTELGPVLRARREDRKVVIVSCWDSNTIWTSSWNSSGKVCTNCVENMYRLSQKRYNIHQSFAYHIILIAVLHSQTRHGRTQGPKVLELLWPIAHRNPATRSKSTHNIVCKIIFSRFHTWFHCKTVLCYGSKLCERLYTVVFATLTMVADNNQSTTTKFEISCPAITASDSS